MNGIQLELFGMSADENHFTSTLWGVLTFFPAPSNKWKDTCRHCLCGIMLPVIVQSLLVLQDVPTMNA